MADQAHREANTRRVRLYPKGQVQVGRDNKGNNLDFKIDHQFYLDLKEFHDDHKAAGYLSPFAFAHEPISNGPMSPAEQALLKALTPGLVTELGEDAEGIWGDVYFADGVVKLWDGGLLSSVSPSHYTNFKNPHTGKVYRRGLREVSAIGVRHLKDLPTQSGYYQLAEGASWTAITQLEESPMTTPKIEIEAPAALTSTEIAKLIADGIKAGLEPITATVTALGEQVEAIKIKPADQTTTQLGEQGETPEAKRVRELEAQVTKLTRDAAIAQSKASLMARLPGADQPLVTSLAETLLVAPAAEIQIKALEGLHGVEALKARAAAGQTTTTILGERGAQGEGGGGGKVPLSRAKLEAAAAGKKPGQEQLTWAVGKYGQQGLDYNA